MEKNNYKAYLIIQEIDRRNELRKKEHNDHMKKLTAAWDIYAALESFWCKCDRKAEKTKESVRPRSFCENTKSEKVVPHLNLDKVINDLKIVHKSLDNAGNLTDSENEVTNLSNSNVQVNSDSKDYYNKVSVKNDISRENFHIPKRTCTHKHSIDRQNEFKKPISAPNFYMHYDTFQNVYEEDQPVKHYTTTCTRYNGLQDRCDENHCKMHKMQRFKTHKAVHPARGECSKIWQTRPCADGDEDHVFWTYPMEKTRHVDDTRRDILKEMVAQDLLY